MPVLVQFTFTTPILDTAFQRAPGATLRPDGHYVLESGDIGWRVWVESADFDEFETGLEADETVASYAPIDRGGFWRFYKVRLSEAGRRASILPLLGECSGEFVNGELTADGWTIRLRFPDNAALKAFVGACKSRENESITVESIRQEACGHGPEFGLTPSQREALCVALEGGYFDIPRRTTLAGLADSIGVSDQAVSERLRRAQKRVFGQILATEEGRDGNEK